MIITATHTRASETPNRLRLAPVDIEEAIVRCGWTVLNSATDISEADRAEIGRLEPKPFVEMPDRTSADALAWWNARLLP